MDESARKAARGMVMRHEGFRDRPYRDSMGYITVGYGHCLDFRPVSERAAQVILDDDLDWFIDALERSVPVFPTLDPVRQAALVDMAFNLGLVGIMKFRQMWKAIVAGDWERASAEVLASRWPSQVGQRALDCARTLRTGKA